MGLFLAAGKSRVYTVNSIIHLTNNLILNLLFIKPFGLIGIALATVISNLIQIAIQNYQIGKIINMNGIKLFPFKDFFLSISISLLVFGLTYYLYINTIGFQLITGIIVMVCTIALSTVILSYIVNREILDYIVNLSKKYLKL